MISPQNHKQNKLRTFYLAICFMLLFCAYGACSNMVSQLFDQIGYTNLGQATLSSLYMGYSVMSFFSAYIIEFLFKNNYKISFFIAAIGYNLFIIFGFVLIAQCDDEDNVSKTGFCSENIIYPLGIFASFITGLAASIIWITQGGYFDSMNMKVEEKQKGDYLSIFYSVFQTSGVIGGVVSIFTLNVNTFYFFLVWAVVGILSLFSFIFVKNPQNLDQNLSNIQQNKENISNKIENKQENNNNNNENDDNLKDNDQIDTILLQNSQIQEQKTICDGLKSIFRMVFKVKQIVPLLVLMAYTGFQIAFIQGYMYIIITSSLSTKQKEDQTTENQLVTAVFISQGLFEVIGGFVAGKVANKFKLKNLTQIGLFLSLVTIGLSQLNLKIKVYWLCYIIAAIWGFSDCFLTSICQQICSLYYPGRLEIMGIFRIFQAVAVSIMQIVIIIVDSDYVIIIYFVSVILTSGIFFTLKKPDFTILDNFEHHLERVSRAQSIISQKQQ